MMALCRLCKANEGIYKVRNKLTDEIFFICEFCDEPSDIELIENNKILEEENIEYGRLHFVKKTRNIFKCRICGNEILIGSSCYTQSIHQKPFPIQTRVCCDCSKDLIKNGIKVVEK
jgi:hypothetical protein